jgi:hypothetical protein
MEFKMREQERRELTHATVALVEQREIVKFFRLSERLRFSHGRFKLGPWQHGEQKIPGGLEAAADAGGNGKAARFVITGVFD